MPYDPILNQFFDRDAGWTWNGAPWRHSRTVNWTPTDYPALGPYRGPLEALPYEPNFTFGQRGPVNYPQLEAGPSASARTASYLNKFGSLFGGSEPDVEAAIARDEAAQYIAAQNRAAWMKAGPNPNTTGLSTGFTSNLPTGGRAGAMANASGPAPYSNLSSQLDFLSTVPKSTAVDTIEVTPEMYKLLGEVPKSTYVSPFQESNPALANAFGKAAGFATKHPILGKVVPSMAALAAAGYGFDKLSENTDPYSVPHAAGDVLGSGAKGASLGMIAGAPGAAIGAIGGMGYETLRHLLNPNYGHEADAAPRYYDIEHTGKIIDAYGADNPALHDAIRDETNRIGYLNEARGMSKDDAWKNAYDQMFGTVDKDGKRTSGIADTLYSAAQNEIELKKQEAAANHEWTARTLGMQAALAQLIPELYSANESARMMGPDYYNRQLDMLNRSSQFIPAILANEERLSREASARQSQAAYQTEVMKAKAKNSASNTLDDTETK